MKLKKSPLTDAENHLRKYPNDESAPQRKDFVRKKGTSCEKRKEQNYYNPARPPLQAFDSKRRTPILRTIQQELVTSKRISFTSKRSNSIRLSYFIKSTLKDEKQSANTYERDLLNDADSPIKTPNANQRKFLKIHQLHTEMGK